MVALAETTGDARLVEEAAALMKQYGIKATHRNLRHLIARLNAEASAPRILPLSEATSEFIRDITYFIKN
jgi:hypothetical protein